MSIYIAFWSFPAYQKSHAEENIVDFFDKFSSSEIVDYDFDKKIKLCGFGKEWNVTSIKIETYCHFWYAGITEQRDPANQIQHLFCFNLDES